MLGGGRAGGLRSRGMPADQRRRWRGHLRLGLWFVEEPVPEAAHGDQMLRTVRVAFDLLTEPFHVHVQGLRIAEVIGAPYLFDQEVTRQEPAFPQEERLQQ